MANPLHAADQPAGNSYDFGTGRTLKPQLIDVCFQFVLLRLVKMVHAFDSLKHQAYFQWPYPAFG